MSLLNKKSVCVITGASRGIGEGLAIQFAKCIAQDSVLILLARSVPDLEVVQTKVLALPECKKSNVKVIIKRFDQGSTNKEDFESLFSSIFKENNIFVSEFQQGIMIHNAGTLDETKFCKNLHYISKTGQFFQINLTGMITLNAIFLQEFSKLSKVVVNMSSLAAVMPIKSWGLYCTVKSGRDMFFKILAIEDPSIRVLNYAPGPVKTDMMNIVQTQSEDTEIQETYQKLNKEEKLLTAEMTCSKFMEILELNKFESGVHIDYYDEY
ncbi:hypothetical protein LOTGIDRAFT_114065 [Lottia gigantea]|uniref:Sepiapterin reductase n=1 Tax=Lottia gigantea TaxID=225164 RepID=V4AYW0_LOTGI|nr:hypothetical protein LOTGIDRAFT_114065 [Lottia gigantea]ESO98896.1 hypothetical protein LOTGIDRAFT_114065 [Lottia gigantea]